MIFLQMINKIQRNSFAIIYYQYYNDISNSEILIVKFNLYLKLRSYLY